jgi:hypothetical protein
LFELRFDEKRMEQLFLEEFQKNIKQLESRFTFWDLDELCKQTCMSINNIKDKFFYDPRFPKYKVGGKWFIPAKEAEDFLLQWIKEQPRN